MPTNRSDKSRFASRYGGGWVTQVQYLAEAMCGRMAAKDRQSLPMKFWGDKKWKKPFLTQMHFARKALNKFSIHAIMRAMRTDRGRQAYSLGAPFLVSLIEQAQKELDLLARNQVEPPAEIPSTTQAPRPSFAAKPSVLNRLRGID